jgi:hypothetical protein
MVEQVEIHVVIVRLMVSFGDGEVLVQVEGDHILETHLSVLVHPDKLAVDS